jgi:hypothetical protein
MEKAVPKVCKIPPTCDAKLKVTQDMEIVREKNVGFDGRGDTAECNSMTKTTTTTIQSSTPSPAPTTSTRPHHEVYMDREFLLYLKDSPYCQKFPEHIFFDPDMPIVRRDISARGSMTRAVSCP